MNAFLRKHHYTASLTASDNRGSSNRRSFFTEGRSSPTRPGFLLAMVLFIFVAAGCNEESSQKTQGTEQEDTDSTPNDVDSQQEQPDALGCLQDAVVISSQQDLDAVQDYTCTEDDVEFNSDTLTELNWPKLTRIGGRLRIYKSSLITDLTGLDNLTEIDGDLSIAMNGALSSLEGLHHLTAVNGSTTISNNSQLADLDGLRAVQKFVAGLTIDANAALESLEGLSAVTAIGARNTNSEALYIKQNANLKTLAGIERLTTVGSVAVTDNGSLVDLAGLSGLTSIDGSLFVLKNHALVNLQGLNNLETVSESVQIGFPTVGNGNDSLTSLGGLEKLEYVGDSLLVCFNASLEDIGALSALQTVGNNLKICGNDSLVTVDGLASLVSVAGDLAIGSYSTYGGMGNASLSSLAGLSALRSVGGMLAVAQNPQLPYCEVCALLGNLDTIPQSGEIDFSENRTDTCGDSTGFTFSTAPMQVSDLNCL